LKVSRRIFDGFASAPENDGRSCFDHFWWCLISG